MPTYIYNETGQKLTELPCQNCGELVSVLAPFYGCVFCVDCMKTESYESADAPEFKERLWHNNTAG